MIDPQMVEAMKTSFGLRPTSTHVAPIPTVVPNVPIYEKISETGTRTLWVSTSVLHPYHLLKLSGRLRGHVHLDSCPRFLDLQNPSGMFPCKIQGTQSNIQQQKRLYHVLTTFITAFATLSYFAMATGSGNSFAHIVVRETHKHVPDTVEHVFRQVFWARYVDWSLTTPLLLLDLAFLAGLNGANILVAIVADLVMILTGLFAAYGVTEGQKWGWYAMACVAYLIIVYQLAIPGRRAVLAKDSHTAKLFASIAGFTVVIWTLYPIVWGIGDGARKWSVDAEIIAYAVLDILAKPVFGFWLLFAHGKAIQSVEGFWSYGLTGEGGVRLDDDA